MIVNCDSNPPTTIVIAVTQVSLSNALRVLASKLIGGTGPESAIPRLITSIACSLQKKR